MILIDFGFTKLSFEKGILFGSYEDFPVKTARLLIATVTYSPKSTRNLIMRAVQGLAQDKDWLIKNSRQLKELENQTFNEVTDRLEGQYRAGRERDMKKIEKLQRENSDLKNDNRHLTRAIEIVKNA